MKDLKLSHSAAVKHPQDPFALWIEDGLLPADRQVTAEHTQLLHMLNARVF